MARASKRDRMGGTWESLGPDADPAAENDRPFKRLSQILHAAVHPGHDMLRKVNHCRNIYLSKYACTIEILHMKYWLFIMGIIIINMRKDNIEFDRRKACN